MKFCKISDATDEMESEHLLSPGRVKSEMFVYAEQGGGGKPVEVQGEGAGGAHRWLNDRTSHAGGTTAATCYFRHLVMTW